MTDITLEDIKDFSKKYNNNSVNKIIENAITNNGLENTMLNREIIIENQPVFNIELPESTRYDQKASYKCWIYAGFNMIKYNMAENLNIDVKNLKLSSNYISFFDRLEKANALYNQIAELDNVSLDYLEERHILDYAGEETGYWEFFKSLVLKYGLVPYEYMPDTKESIDVDRITTVYTEKVLKDISKIIKLKEQRIEKEELQSEVKKYLSENYEILSKILGEPPKSFDYEYEDKQNNYHVYKNMTPMEFRDKFMNLNLEDFVNIGNVPKYNKKYNKIYTRENYKNLEESKLLNLPITYLKDFTIKQLKEGIPVYIGIYVRQFRDKKSGVLDTRLFDYNGILGIEPLTKEEGLSIGVDKRKMHHIMVITGVHVVDDKPIRWKVEDTYGDKEKKNGCYIMNDNYFDKYVYNVIVNKKYLSEEYIKLLDQQPINYIDNAF